MNKALFLDRDGVINVDHGYVGRYADFEYIDGIFDLVRHFQDKGFMPVIVTNQSGIARGLYTEADFFTLMRRVQDDFAEHGTNDIAVYHCPHHIEGKVSQYAIECDCRKPKPGMFYLAAKQLNIDTQASIMIGDSWRDIVAADAAGVRESIFINNASVTQSMSSLLSTGHKVNQVSSLTEVIA
ncbi:D-glycero-alpha-D-manno-heptose-1,7-bisphosphate 7-phosphatase [Alteromonas gracilis]|uniref:D-glycero-alpha-D-manno-heptose-1,7-bisphosphate 7-phosphatase n=1 Tax=Alteromonas gracilis TaxID=1479524 RepID=UPI0030CBAF40